MDNYKDVIEQGIATADGWNGTTDLERVILGFLSPSTQQTAEFGQQAALTKYLNSDAYKDRFEAMVDAGINPAAAAQALGVSAGASAPNSAIGAGSGALQAGAAIADSVGNVADKLATAKETRTLLDERKKNLISDTFLKFTQSGYNQELAKGLAIANAYLPTEKFLGLLSLSSHIDNLHAEYQSIMQSINESKFRIKEIDAQIRLAESQRNLNEKLQLESEKRTLEIEARTKEQNWLNQQMALYGVNPRNPIESNVFLAGVRDGKTSYDSQVGIIRDIHYNEATGQYDANEEHSYLIARNTALGNAFASWLTRPTSPASIVADMVYKVQQKFKSNKVSQKDALEEIKRHNQFLKSYQQFKGELKSDLNAKRKAYKDAKRLSNSQEAATKYREYQNALNVYDSFDEDDFAALLLHQYR